MKKIYVLDTNVLLYDPYAITKFEDNTIIIPITVIEEIDRFKKDTNQTGRNAREVSRLIDAYRHAGSLAIGVPLANGGTLKVEIYEEKVMKRLPPELREERGDNRILAVAVDLMVSQKEQPVILVTKATGLRIKADALGLNAADYDADEVIVEPASEAGQESVGLGAGGYIILDLPRDKRSLFHDLLKGFEDYSRIKGYEVSFSVDATLTDKIAFKFTIVDDFVSVSTGKVRKDFQEYINKVINNDDFGEMPMVVSFEEHLMLVTAMRNRINFLKNSYDLVKNSADLYEALIQRSLNISAGPSQNIVVQPGGVMDSRTLTSLNSSNIALGSSNSIQGAITTVTIGDSFGSIKEQIAVIDRFVAALKVDPHQDENIEVVIRNVEKVKDELEGEPVPDKSRVAKWLGFVKQTLQLGCLGQETVAAAKELLAAFGVN